MIKTYMMVWHEGEETNNEQSWYYYGQPIYGYVDKADQIEKDLNNKFPDGYVIYLIDVDEDGIIIDSSWEDKDVGQTFKERYGKFFPETGVNKISGNAEEHIIEGE